MRPRKFSILFLFVLAYQNYVSTGVKKLKTKNMSEVVNFDGLKKTLNSNKKK